MTRRLGTGASDADRHRDRRLCRRRTGRGSLRTQITHLIRARCSAGISRLALQLAAGGQITARGTLGSAAQVAPQRHVYDGDQPSPHPSAWQEAMAEISAAVMLVRTDRDAAPQLLVLLTVGCRTLDRFEEERAYLFGIGIPAGFLPSARELGRSDLP